MSGETDGQIELAPDALSRDPIDADEVAAAVAAVAKDAAATAANAKTAEEAAIEAAVGEEASVLISEAAAGMIFFCVHVHGATKPVVRHFGHTDCFHSPYRLLLSVSTINSSRSRRCCSSICCRPVCRG